MADTRINVILGAKDEASKVVTGLRGQFEKFKSDAMAGFGLGAGIQAFSLLQRGVGTVVDIMGDAVGAASALSETQAKVGQVYKTTSDQVLAWGENAAEAMGMSTQKALEANATFGNFTQALGATEQQSMEMSGSLVQLAADLASFNNMNPEDVLVSLRSGMAGEAEPMRRLGADVSAARIELELMEMGVEKVNGKFTESDKIMGRYRAIMEDTSTAQGDFARTSDGLANTQRTLSANIEDLMADVGAAILPIATAITQVAVDAIDAVQGLVEGIGDLADAAIDFLDPGKQTRETIESIAKTLTRKGSVSLRTFAESLRYTGEETAFLEAQLDGLGIKEANQASLMSNLARISVLTGAELSALVEDALDLTDSLQTQNFEMQDATTRTKMFEDAIAGIYEKYGLLNPFIEENAEVVSDSSAAVSEATGIYLRWTQETVEGQAHLAKLNAEFDVLSGMMGPVTAGIGETNDAMSDLATGGEAEVQQMTATVVASLRNLPPSMAKTITDGKEAVRTAMAELRLAMEQPFADEKYADWLEKRAEKANTKLINAIAAGNVPAANAAFALREAIQAELQALEDQTYSVQILVDPVTGRRRPDAAPGRAVGGPVAAGQTYLVGERGPELLTMGRQSGNITPNHQLGGGGDVYLDGYLVGRVIDERLGRQYGTASRVSAYRRSN